MTNITALNGATTIHAAIFIRNLHFTYTSTFSICSFYSHFTSSNICTSAYQHIRILPHATSACM